jgi:type II secretory pathway component GspD/PulD (secretin)
MKTILRTLPAALLCLSLSAIGAEPFTHPDAKIIDMEFRDAQISDVIRIIAEASGLNIVATNEAASKSVTLYLHSVSARQAIEIISKIGGLWYRYDSDADVYRIMTTQEYQKDLVVFREEKTRVFKLLYPNPTGVASAIRDVYGQRVKYSEVRSNDALATLGSLGGGIGGQGASSGQFSRPTGNDFSGGQSQFFGGQFQTSGGSGGGGSGGTSKRVLDEKLTADQIALLEQRLGQEHQASSEHLKGISRQEQDIFVVVVPDQNMVAVRTSDLEAMDNIARLIQQMDQPTSEVLLEMKILDLTLGDSFHSLFDVKFEDGKNSFGLGNFVAGLNGATLLYKFIDDHVKANIELLQRDNRVDVLATPLLMASNNRPAQLFIGEERVIVTGVDTNTITSVNGSTTSFINPRTELRNVGNTLRILPKINADRTITLAVQQDTSSVLPKSASLPISDGSGGVVDFPIDSVNTANLSATIVAKDGMSIAIGGMIRTTVSNDVQKVPLLGDIPYVGALFSKELRDRKKTEMVLLITPHIMMAPQEAQRVSDRVAPELSRHPYFDNGDGAYEYYFDKHDPEGRDDRPWSQPANPHPNHPRDRLRLPEKRDERPAGAEADVREPYAGLIRFAAMAARHRIAPDEAPEGIRLEPLGAIPDKPLFSEIGVDTTPLQSWRKDDLYVTSIQVKNRLRLPVRVDSSRLRGRWLATTMERPDLAEQGKHGDTTYLYVVSAEPFHKALGGGLN